MSDVEQTVLSKEEVEERNATRNRTFNAPTDPADDEDKVCIACS